MDFSQYLEYFNNTLASLDTKQVEEMVDLVVDAYDHDRTVFVIGNGGSASNASHLANDLVKGTLKSMDQTKRLKALALTDNLALMTAYANDEGYQTIFEQQLRTFAKPNDLVIAISGSGNSPNVIKAIEWANANGLHTIGVTGFGGGKLKEIAKTSVHVPLNDMCTSESVHSVIFHYLALELQKRLYAERVEAAAAV
jgi:D-sedoheptulose 7-phosphate isomerase